VLSTISLSLLTKGSSRYRSLDDASRECWGISIRFKDGIYLEDIASMLIIVGKGPGIIFWLIKFNDYLLLLAKLKSDLTWSEFLSG
jgi:hypothetical protein